MAQDETLLHGSWNPNLQPGDIIEPRHALPGSTMKYDKNTKVAYATPSLSWATRYARGSQEKTPSDEAPTLFGAVYEVEPMNPDDVEESTFQRISPSGYRVLNLRQFVNYR